MVSFSSSVSGVIMASAVVEVKPKEGESDAECLDPRCGTAEPEDRDGDDKDAFDEGGDGVRDG